MEQEKMRQLFNELYETMARGRNVSDMKFFGRTMAEMMGMIILEHPDLAGKYLDRLSAVKWDNYITKDEAEKILASMIPGAHWDYNTFIDTGHKLSLKIEEEPYYNHYALWVVMNMIYSDSANSIASIMGRDLEGVPDDLMVSAVYLLAKDKLKDEDHVFDIRHYFCKYCE